MFVKMSLLNKLKNLLKNPYLAMALVALVVQSVLLIFFYSLPDPLGLSMSEMFEGKTLWQIFMAFGTVSGTNLATTKFCFCIMSLLLFDIVKFCF